jgi:hypothetical protein
VTIQVHLNGKRGIGRFALIDALDLSVIAPYRWYVWERVTKRGCKKGPYAIAHVRKPDGRMTILAMHTLLTGFARTDHKDGNGLNNQRSNLRAATNSQNAANRDKMRTGTSGYKGVTFDRQTGRWKAQVTVDGRNRHLGRYDTAEEAARAYDRVALEAFGSFARINFP